MAIYKKDLTGEVFGWLTVVEQDGVYIYNCRARKSKKARSTLWKCICICGNIISVPRVHLTNHHTTSCGCKKYTKKESISVGDFYGRLEVVAFGRKTRSHDVTWWCKCICGSPIKEVRAGELKRGTIISCGCYQKEVGGSHPGKDHPNWKGIPHKYCPMFNEALREQVRDFYGRKCYVCGKTEEEEGKKLSCHHTNYNKDIKCQNTKVWMLVPLCSSCHAKTNSNRHFWFNLLYKLNRFYECPQYEELRNNAIWW